MNQKEKFRIRVQYFKPSGKFYTAEYAEIECHNCVPAGQPRCCYMDDAVEHIKKIMAEKRNGTNLPGLAGPTWEGHILLNCEEGFPVLIPNVSR